jgi:hypothetical protein
MEDWVFKNKNVLRLNLPSNLTKLYYGWTVVSTNKKARQRISSSSLPLIVFVNLLCYKRANSKYIERG